MGINSISFHGERQEDCESDDGPCGDFNCPQPTCGIDAPLPECAGAIYERELQVTSHVTGVASGIYEFCYSFISDDSFFFGDCVYRYRGPDEKGAVDIFFNAGTGTFDGARFLFASSGSSTPCNLQFPNWLAAGQGFWAGTTTGFLCDGESIDCIEIGPPHTFVEAEVVML